MVQLRHLQQNLGEVFFAREAESLMEAWMKEVDTILEDERLRDLIYEQLGRRPPVPHVLQYPHLPDCGWR